MNLSINDKIRIKGILSNQLLIGPKSINLHLNTNCNFKCDFCWYHSKYVKDKPKIKYLSYNILSIFIDQVKNMGVEEISLESEGETSLYPNLNKLIKTIIDSNLKISYIYSNGSFKKNQLKYVSLAKIIKINLSASNSFSHSLLQSKSKKEFKKIINNIKNLKKLNKNLKIEIVFIITNKNYEDINNLMILAKKLRIDYISFKMFESTFETKKLIINNEKILLINLLKRILLNKRNVPNNSSDILKIFLSKDYNTYSITLTNDNLHNDRFLYYSKNKIMPKNCYIGWFYSFIDPNGDVISPCDGVGVKIIGNINKTNFKKIWFSKRNLTTLLMAKNININHKRWIECKYCNRYNFNNEIIKFI